MSSFTSSYGWTTYSGAEFQRKANKTAQVIKKIKEKHGLDAIVVTGSSGCALGFPVSYITGVPVVYVRKENERSHGHSIEAMRGAKMSKYVILDDFTDYGTTVRGLREKINAHFFNKGWAPPEMVALVLYEDTGRDRKFSFEDARVPIKRVR